MTRDRRVAYECMAMCLAITAITLSLLRIVMELG